MTGDAINPQHYQGVTVQGVAVQCIDVIEVLDLGFHLGNALKYAWRFGRKHDRLDEEIGKCLWYLDRWRSQGYELRDLARPMGSIAPLVDSQRRVELAGHLRNMCETWRMPIMPDFIYESASWMQELIELLGVEQQLLDHVNKHTHTAEGPKQ